MSETFTCIKCDEDFELSGLFDLLGEIIECPHCRAYLTLDFEENAQGDTWFWLTKAMP